jgi:hypothetical protein
MLALTMQESMTKKRLIRSHQTLTKIKILRFEKSYIKKVNQAECEQGRELIHQKIDRPLPHKTFFKFFFDVYPSKRFHKIFLLTIKKMLTR